MGSIVLVHGAWHGGWCWRKLAALLRAGGHDVFTPTLTGLGERAHLATSEVGLETHIRDVLGVIEYEDLQGVVLVGHSLAGGIITGVADMMPHRIAHLVYLDASVPRDGECDLDCVRPEEREWLEAKALKDGGWLVSPPKMRYPFGVTDESDAEWVNIKLTPHPLKAFTDRLSLSSDETYRGPHTFIYCSEGTEGLEVSPSVQRASTEPGWQFYELETAHDSMVTAPQELSDLLSGLC